MQIDAHHHFWHYRAEDYGWISDGMPALKRDYLPDELSVLLERTGIDGTIAVQARQVPGETDWLLELARDNDFIRGVVGWVDLSAPDLNDQLKRYGAHSKFRGIRHQVHDEADDRFMLQPAVLAGLKTVAEFDLVYDLLLFPRHLPVAVEVVEQLPQLRFVLDHIAKPPIKAGEVEPWATQIRALARSKNVYCKVSGMVTEADWQHWKLVDFQRYLDVVLQCFGPERLIFGTDWPVCTLAASYAEVVLLLQSYIREFSSQIQAAVMGGNATEWYRLPSP